MALRCHKTMVDVWTDSEAPEDRVHSTRRTQALALDWLKLRAALWEAMRLVEDHDDHRVRAKAAQWRHLLGEAVL